MKYNYNNINKNNINKNKSMNKIGLLIKEVNRNIKKGMKRATINKMIMMMMMMMTIGMGNKYRQKQ